MICSLNFRSCYNSRPLNLTPNVMQTSSTWYMHGVFKYKFIFPILCLWVFRKSSIYYFKFLWRFNFIFKVFFFIYTFLVLIVLDLHISILKPRFPLVSIIKCKMRKKKKAIKKQRGYMNFGHQYLIHKMMIFVL